MTLVQEVIDRELEGRERTERRMPEADEPGVKRIRIGSEEAVEKVGGLEAERQEEKENVIPMEEEETEKLRADSRGQSLEPGRSSESRH